MVKIVTVYTDKPRKHDVEARDLVPIDMSYIRWCEISGALARRGHQVDMAMPDVFKKWSKGSINYKGINLGTIPLSDVEWEDYDVVKTLFDIGFETLEKYGGINHPFIISKLGSVVGSEDMEGIYFYGKVRERLYLTQVKVNQYSKYITLLSKPARELWRRCFRRKENILLVPGGVDYIVPKPTRNPYPKGSKKKCIFAGNLYTKDDQPEANTVLIKKLNVLGKLLLELGIELYILGPGDVGQLDKSYVSYLGVASYEKTWDYLYFADVGIVASAGRFMHNNESSKIYHYLRIGLPVVSESGFPNDYVITQSKLGFIVKSENLDLMAQKIKQAANRQDWDKEYAINYILKNHTWEKRVEVYDKVINEHFT